MEATRDFARPAPPAERGEPVVICADTLTSVWSCGGSVYSLGMKVRVADMAPPVPPLAEIGETVVGAGRLTPTSLCGGSKCS